MKVTRYIIPVLFFLIGITPRAHAQTAERENSVSAFLKAYHYYQTDKNLDSATLWIDKSLMLDNANDAAWFLKSRVARLKKNQDEAAEAIERAYELESKNAEYALAYADCLIDANNIEKAAATLEQAIADNPKEENLYNRLLTIYILGKSGDKTHSVLEKYKANMGETPMYYMFCYNSYSYQNNAEMALQTLLQANEKFPNPSWEEFIAEEYLKQAKDSLAEVYYNKVLAGNPNSTAAIFGKMELARTNEQMEQYFPLLERYLMLPNIRTADKCTYIEEVFKSPYFFNNHTERFAESLTEFSETFPQDTTAGYLAARFNIVAKRENASLDILKRLQKYHPAEKGVAINYVSLCYTLKRWDDILEYTQKQLDANEIEGIDEFLLQSRLTAQYFKEDYNGALKTCKALEQIAKERNNQVLLVEAYSNMGDIAHLLKKRKESYKYYEKALSIDPEYCPVLNNYAYQLASDAKKKNLDKAQQMSKITIEKERGNSTYLDTYAYILFRQGKNEEAKRYYQQALAYGSDLSSTIYKHYAECLMALGEYDLAKAQYMKALNLAIEEGDSNEIKAIENELAQHSDILKNY